MNDYELDMILEATRPPADAELAPIDLEAAFAAMLLDLDAEAEPTQKPRRRLFPGRRTRIAIAGGLALVLLAVVALAGILRSEDDLSAYAAEAIEVAEANRRLLVMEPGWAVNYAQWNETESGDVGFIDGDSLETSPGMVELSWYSDVERSRYVDYSERKDTFPVEIDGQDVYAQIRSGPNAGAVSFATALPPEDGAITVITGGMEGDVDDVIAVLESIEPVDTETWLEAMPDSVVQPSDQSSEIDRLLEGVPLPDGFDRSALDLPQLPQDSYQLTAHVMYGAYCGWLDAWWKADQAGDSAAADEAIDELEASTQWPAVVAQKDTGALDDDFRMYANTVAAGDASPEVYDQMMNCTAY
jgi:hypothetical protein